MKIKEGFEIVDLCGDHVIVATGLKNIDFSKVISLNESAILMWNAVEGKEFTVEDLAKALTDEYEVDLATAMNDAGKIAQEWKEIGLIDD